MKLERLCNQIYNLGEQEFPLKPEDALNDILIWAYATDNYPMAQIFCLEIYGHNRPTQINPDEDKKKFSKFSACMDPILSVAICKIGRVQ